MVLTSFQRDICRLIARNRVEGGESYVAGGAALNEATGGARVSRDLDLFHDSTTAVLSTFDADCALLAAAGYALRDVRQRPGYAEAVVARGAGAVVLQWTADSAFRFFPLVEHADFGLALHPFDLATNKVLALVGRLEARDWIDMIEANDRIQPLGLLAWAAVGKDAGFSPPSILEHAARSARYTQAEISALDFDGAPPSAAGLARRWRAILEEARSMVAELPPGTAGRCVTDGQGRPWRGTLDELHAHAASNALHFHAGTLRGALPSVDRP